VELTKYNVQVATEILAWPSDKLRRVSVNSFGYGGANAHCILDHVSLLSLDTSKANSVISLNTNESTEAFSSRSLDSPTLIRPGKLRSHCAATRRLVLLPFSGHDEKALQRAEAGVLGGILKASLADVAYTLSCRRSRYRYRSYALVNADAHDSVSVVSKGVSRKTQEVRSPTIAFVFTGLSLFDTKPLFGVCSQSDLIQDKGLTGLVWAPCCSVTRLFAAQLRPSTTFCRNCPLLQGGEYKVMIS
jgi:acyl transferase domain-containing protein